MSTEQKIYYKKVRDLGAIFGAAFAFIKQNFKPVFGSILLYAGPFLLLATVISSFVFGASLGLSGFFNNRMESLIGEAILSLAVTIIFSFIGVTVYNVVLNRNIIENEKLSAGETLTIKHSTINFWTDFWRILGNTLLLVIVVIISIVTLVLVFTGIFSLMGEGGGTDAAITAVIAILLLLVVFLIFGPILLFVPMAALFICQRDRMPVFSAIGKVFYYMRDNFWATWAVSFVGFLTYWLMSMIAQIPVFIVTMITTFSRVRDMSEGGSTSILLIIVTALSTLLTYCVLVTYHLIAVYQFTNLEEKKEGSGILQKINQIE